MNSASPDKSYGSSEGDVGVFGHIADVIPVEAYLPDFGLEEREPYLDLNEPLNVAPLLDADDFSTALADTGAACNPLDIAEAIQRDQGLSIYVCETLNHFRHMRRLSTDCATQPIYADTFDRLDRAAGLIGDASGRAVTFTLLGSCPKWRVQAYEAVSTYSGYALSWIPLAAKAEDLRDLTPETFDDLLRNEQQRYTLDTDLKSDDADARKSQFFTADSLQGKDVPPRDWLVSDWIPGRNVTLIYGDGGTGKSLLTLQLAVAVATGERWIGLNPKQGKAIYISAEDEKDELHRRLTDIAAGIGRPLSDFHALTARSLAGEDALLAHDGPQLKTTDLYKEIHTVAAQIKPKLIVLDTLADLYPANENDRAKARQFVGFLKRIAIEHDCAVVVLAHPSLTGLSSGSGTSGSTGWNNSVRSRLYMSRIKDKEHEPDVDARTLSKKKNNYGPAGGEISLRWERGVFVTDGAKNGSGPDLNRRAQDVFLKLLVLLREQGRDVSPNSGASFAPALFAKHPESEGMTKVAFRTAMENLLSSGKVIVAEVGPPSKRKSRLEIAGENHE